MRTIRQRRSDSARAKNQQRGRRKDCLFLKAFEYCKECDADIFLMVRLKNNGQIFIFNSNDRWPPSPHELVGCYFLSRNDDV
jgi:hypothetical protein